LPAVDVQSLTHRYGWRLALDDVTFSIAAGEVFAFLGPNGGGKTTLFRLLSTLMPVQAGRAALWGHDVQRELDEVRRLIGVVFQAPSLDKKLTVEENMVAQAALYGLHGAAFRARRDEVLKQLGVADRRHDRVETLSGGLRRRVDLAKALLHRPRLLLLDEPTTGLDPGARVDLWRYLRQLREQDQTTIVLTTHLLDEADRADRVAILHAGRLVASGDPSVLRSAVGGNSITVETDQAEWLCRQINQRWSYEATVVDGAVRVGCGIDTAWATQLVDEFPEHVKSVTIGRPTLEDVFIQQTGHRFWQDAAEPAEATANRHS
jgi:ABC-2 type transport system ATP-binding protein